MPAATDHADTDHPGTDHAVRTDARRNRVRVLRAASQAFAAEGMSVSLERIARTAGLGAGTVYRHFPSKESLLEAVLVQRIDHLVDRAGWWAAAAAPDPALFGFLAEVIRLTGDHRVLCDAFQSDSSWPRVGFTAAGRRFEHAVGQLLRAAQRAGAVRAEVTVGEVNTLILGCAVMHRAHPEADGAGVVRRVLDTLRPVTVTEAIPFRDGSGPDPVRCAVCGAVLRREPTGRPARYCGAACRQRAHRQRASARGRG